MITAPMSEPVPLQLNYRVVDFRPQLPDLRGGFPARGREDIRQIVIHHTATCPHRPDAACQPWEELIRGLYRIHTEKFFHPGYHFHYTATPDPAWYYTADLLTARTAAASGHRESIHVAIIGNYQAYPPREEVRRMVAERVRLLRTWLKTELPVLAHEDLEPGCGCPGATWPDWKASLTT